MWTDVYPADVSPEYQPKVRFLPFSSTSMLVVSAKKEQVLEQVTSMLVKHCCEDLIKTILEISQRKTGAVISCLSVLPMFYRLQFIRR